MFKMMGKMFAIGAKQAAKVIKAGPSAKNLAVAAEKVAKAAAKLR